MKRGQEEKIYEFLSNLNGQLYIPIYQREYSWNKENREYFWEHIVGMNLNNSKRTHYCHSILTKEYSGSVFDLPEIAIIDGQQRVTTSSLFYASICAFCKEHEIDFDWENKIYNKVLINNAGEKDKKYRLKLKDGKDNDTFTMIVDDLPISLSKKAGNGMIIETYNFFLNKLTVENVLDILAKFDRFTIGNDIAEDHDSAQLLFETINYAGTPLKEYQILRSYTLLNFEQEEQNLMYYRYWVPIMEYFNNIAGKLNKFINGFVAYALNQVEPSISPMRYIKEKEDENYSKEDFLKEVTDYFEKFKVIDNGTGIDEVDKSIEVILSLNNVFLYPLLIKIYDFYVNDDIDLQEFIASIKLIETQMMRQKIVNKASFGHTFRVVFNKIKWDSKNVFNTLYNIFDKNNMIISDAVFKGTIVTSDFYEDYKPQLTFKVLECIENSFYPNGHISLKNELSKYSIEHIMPQTLNKDWQFIDEITHKSFVHSLGNLTLTAYNSKLSNKSFKEKLEMDKGFKADRLCLNKSVAVYNHWNEDTIAKRTEMMADVMVELWQYPSFMKNGLLQSQSLLVGGK